MRFSSKPWVAFLSSSATGGLYYYGYRFYDPYLQRWLNRDPVGITGGVNAYWFVGNTPADTVDPSGEKAIPIRDKSGKVVAYVYDDIMNCTGYACRQPGGVNVPSDATWAEALAAMGYQCTTGISAKDCKTHCNCEDYVEFYLYIRKTVPFEPVHRQLKGCDPLNTPWGKLRGLGIDYHSLRGESDGTYTYVGRRYPRNSPVVERFPSGDIQWPDYFGTDQMVAKACCCKK
jgi:RHS repeat-associated protein